MAPGFFRGNCDAGGVNHLRHQLSSKCAWVHARTEEADVSRSFHHAAIHGFVSGQSDAAEVIVVDDGSDDATASVAEERQAAMAELRVIRNPHRGKAYAVRTGVLASNGDVVFVCDADLSMPIEEVV